MCDPPWILRVLQWRWWPSFDPRRRRLCCRAQPGRGGNLWILNIASSFFYSSYFKYFCTDTWWSLVVPPLWINPLPSYSYGIFRLCLAELSPYASRLTGSYFGRNENLCVIILKYRGKCVIVILTWNFSYCSILSRWNCKGSW